jgi:hypothetical protein
MKIEIHIEDSIAEAAVNIWLVGRDHNNKRFIFKPCDLVATEYNYSMRHEPTFKIQEPMASEFLPSLADALVKSGYRDKNREHKTDIDNHLKDLQKITYTLLEYVKPRTHQKEQGE